MRFQTFLNEKMDRNYVTKEETDEFISRWKSKLKSYGITWVEFSTHFIMDRLNHTRNNPSIQIDELDYMLNGFLKKVGAQFKKDVDNVKKHISKKRGLNKQEIPDNELEFAITSKSNDVKFVFVLKQDKHKKGTAMILPMTIIRKKKFRITKGEQVMIEGRI